MAEGLPIGVERELRFHFRDTRYTSGKPTCVVTSRSDYTWHHLNHDHNDHRLSNVVPLIQRLNKNLFDAMNDPGHLKPLLECDALRDEARSAFWQHGQAARAFGCIRIAYYVALYKEMPFSDRMDWARQALYYARHKPNYSILEELLAETILMPLGHHEDAISPEVVRSLLQEFEALLTLGGDTKGAASLSEYSRNAAAPKDEIAYAGALRRTAHSLGTNIGPSKEVLDLLKESASIAPKDVNQSLNVASSMDSLYMGEDTDWGHQKALEIASEQYESLLASKIDVHHDLIWPSSRESDLPILPLRASPSNIAHLCLVRAVELAIHKPLRWEDSLLQAICLAEYYWDLAGAKIDGPGRGTWKRITDRLDSNHPLQWRLIYLITKLVAPPFSSTLTESIHQAAKRLVARL